MGALPALNLAVCEPIKFDTLSQDVEPSLFCTGISLVSQGNDDAVIRTHIVRSEAIGESFGLSFYKTMFDTVRVTFAVDLYTFRGEVTANIVLLSENSVIGTCELTVEYDDENERVTAAQDVKLTYHNSGAITGYVDHLSGTYFE